MSVQGLNNLILYFFIHILSAKTKYRNIVILSRNYIDNFTPKGYSKEY